MSEMTIEAAAAFVDAIDNPTPAPVAETPVAPVEAAPEAEVQEIAPEGAEVEAEALVEGEEDGEEVEAAPAVDAPQWWDASDKAVFSSLTPEAQAAVARNEEKREAVTQKAKTEAKAEALAAVTPEVEKLRSLSAQLEGVIPNELGKFQEEYGNIDWQKMPEWAAAAPEAYNQWMAVYNAKRMALENTLHAKAEADRVAQATFAKTTADRLAIIAPDVAKDPKILKALGDYLPTTGMTNAQLADASAEELVILNKARLYDEMMAKAVAKPVPPTVKTAQTPVKIAPQGGARPPSTSQQRQAQALGNRFAQTRSIEDAAALIALKGF